MTTDTFDLLFLESVRASPVSHVFVKTSTQHEYKGVKNSMDYILLTPRFEDATELGKFIDAMCEDLQEIKRVAAKKYKAAEDRRRGSRRPAQ